MRVEIQDTVDPWTAITAAVEIAIAIKKIGTTRNIVADAYAEVNCQQKLTVGYSVAGESNPCNFFHAGGSCFFSWQEVIVFFSCQLFSKFMDCPQKEDGRPNAEHTHTRPQQNTCLVPNCQVIRARSTFVLMYSIHLKSLVA